jgi:hypothetical protein
MLDLIEKTLKRPNKYTELSYEYRRFAESRFLERDENQDCYVELFTTPYGSADRKNLNRFNKTI